MTVASQTLLNLVVQLQQVMSVAQGRAMLLDYARRNCGARLALLFALDREREALVLLEQSGRAPHAASSPERAPSVLPLHGLFASVLRHGGSLNIPDISQNTLSLPEERAWAWPSGRVLLYSMRQGWHQGVLVFCFSPAGARTHASPTAQEELLICVSLLSAYLSREVEFPSTYGVTGEPEKAKQRTRRSSKAEEGATTIVQEEETELLASAEMLNWLTRLCDAGFVTGPYLERQTFYQHILQLLCTTLHGSASSLWLYRAEQQSFWLATSTGEPGILAERASTLLANLTTVPTTAEIEPDCGLIMLPEVEETVLVWYTLRYREQLLGAFGLVIAHVPVLSPEQQLFLSNASEIIAMILFHYEAHLSEQQRQLEQERARIAREIHDSVMQDIAHVAQKLEHIRHILERQPQVALNELEYTRTVLTSSLRDLRYGITSLSPIPLEEQTFDEAIKALIHQYDQSLPRLKIVSQLEHLELWPQTLHAPVYRFMQEALNNIRKHAAASEVEIRIRSIAGLGIVQISDNGNGFVLAEVRKHSAVHEAMMPRMGLLNMEERVRQAGGVLEIRSKPGAGTTLKARFPFSQSLTLLTKREHEVLHLMMEGLTNRAISERLSISPETVKSHVHHIMQKMHVKDRTQAAVLATRQQWV